eukprot:g10549.t1
MVLEHEEGHKFPSAAPKAKEIYDEASYHLGILPITAAFQPWPQNWTSSLPPRSTMTTTGPFTVSTTLGGGDSGYGSGYGGGTAPTTIQGSFQLSYDLSNFTAAELQQLKVTGQNAMLDSLATLLAIPRQDSVSQMGDTTLAAELEKVMTAAGVHAASMHISVSYLTSTWWYGTPTTTVHTTGPSSSSAPFSSTMIHSTTPATTTPIPTTTTTTPNITVRDIHPCVSWDDFMPEKKMNEPRPNIDAGCYAYGYPDYPYCSCPDEATCHAVGLSFIYHTCEREMGWYTTGEHEEHRRRHRVASTDVLQELAQEALRFNSCFGHALQGRRVHGHGKCHESWKLRWDLPQLGGRAEDLGHLSGPAVLPIQPRHPLQTTLAERLHVRGRVGLPSAAADLRALRPARRSARGQLHGRRLHSPWHSLPLRDGQRMPGRERDLARLHLPKLCRRLPDGSGDLSGDDGRRGEGLWEETTCGEEVDRWSVQTHAVLQEASASEDCSAVPFDQMYDWLNGMEKCCSDWPANLCDKDKELATVCKDPSDFLPQGASDCAAHGCSANEHGCHCSTPETCSAVGGIWKTWTCIEEAKQWQSKHELLKLARETETCDGDWDGQTVLEATDHLAKHCCASYPATVCQKDSKYMTPCKNDADFMKNKVLHGSCSFPHGAPTAAECIGTMVAQGGCEDTGAGCTCQTEHACLHLNGVWTPSTCGDEVAIWDLAIHRVLQAADQGTCDGLTAFGQPVPDFVEHMAKQCCSSFPATVCDKSAKRMTPCQDKSDFTPDTVMWSWCHIDTSKVSMNDRELSSVRREDGD